jgi:hypothetical protein
MFSKIQACDAQGAITPPQRSALNGFQHGLRSASVLLRGEDPREFETMRNDMLCMYRPCTREEVRCVNRIAACQWRADRYTRYGTVFDAKLDALLADDTGTVAQHCDPDPHRWQHRAIDCTLQEGRFDRMMQCAERRLLELQKLRRLGLLAPGDRMLAPDDARTAEPVAAVPAAAGQPAEPESPASTPQAAGQEPELVASASPDKQSGKSDERESQPAPASALPPQPPRSGGPAGPRTEAPPRRAALEPQKWQAQALPAASNAVDGGA